MLPASAPTAWPTVSREWRWFLACLFLTLLWDVSGLDQVVMSWLASDTGFPLRHAFWLETVLHDRARQLSYAILLMAVMSALLPWGPIRHLSRLQRFEAISGSLLALLAVNLMKSSSQTSCPWDLEAFGGVAHYVSHWQWFTADGGPGRCFPGGHASTGFAFLALAWPWLESPRAGDRRIGRCVLATFVVAGVLFGVAQTLRGAHYPSHTLWTALICWAVTWAWHRSSVFLMEKVQ